jgi:outer membrane protein assembly factor BamD
MSRRTVALPLVLLLLCASLATGCAARRERSRAEARIVDPVALYQRGIEEIARGRHTRAKTFLDRIQYSPEGRAGLEPLVRLALADLAFYTGDDLSLIDARSKYLDFVTLYGDHPKAPYAQVQAGICSLEQANSPTRDQSQTRVAINDLREVERRYPQSPYVRAAGDLIVRAESNLAEHDFLVGKFYFKRRAWISAADRFRGILDRYPRYAEKEKVYFELGQTLLRMNNPTEAELYLGRLVDAYPNGRYAAEARRLLGRGDDAEKGARKG